LTLADKSGLFRSAGLPLAAGARSDVQQPPSLLKAAYFPTFEKRQVSPHSFRTRRSVFFFAGAGLAQQILFQQPT
jgi:hypothetical protein